MTADGVEPRAGISCSVRLQLYEGCQGESLRITIIINYPNRQGKCKIPGTADEAGSGNRMQMHAGAGT